MLNQAATVKSRSVQRFTDGPTGTGQECASTPVAASFAQVDAEWCPAYIH